MATHGKRYRADTEGWDREKPVPLPDAVTRLKQFKPAKFDQSIEICLHLGIDSKQADQLVRGSVALPNGIGKSKRVIAFCRDDQVETAKASGAIEAGGEALVKKITDENWLDFDVAVASPDMMRVVSRLGKVLGPKGLMPSPKSGTVTPDIAQAVKEYSAGKVEYRADTGGNIHAVIGKLSFAEKDLVANLDHFVKTIEKAKPPTSKGVYIKKITISGAMTPGVQIKHEVAEAKE